MEEKKGKGKIITIIILIIIVLGLGGYIVYDKFIQKEAEPVAPKQTEQVTYDFYSATNLVKYKYIKEIATTEEKTDNYGYLIQIKDGKVYVPEDLQADKFKMIETTGIEGTPKYATAKQFQSISYSIFFVLTEEGDLYYSIPNEAYKDKDNLPIKEFKKVNIEKITNIYGFYNDDNLAYPFNVNTIYAETESGKLLNVNQDNQGKTTFEEDWQYPDRVCGVFQAEACVGLLVDKDKKIYNSYLNGSFKTTIYEELKYENKSLEVKDAFSITKYTNNYVVSELTYYIITSDNSIYKVTTNYNNDSKAKITSIDLYNTEKIKEYKYNEKNDVKSVDITYENGKTENLKDIMLISSLYYRYNK